MIGVKSMCGPNAMSPKSAWGLGHFSRAAPEVAFVQEQKNPKQPTNQPNSNNNKPQKLKIQNQNKKTQKAKSKGEFEESGKLFYNILCGG